MADSNLDLETSSGSSSSAAISETHRAQRRVDDWPRRVVGQYAYNSKSFLFDDATSDTDSTTLSVYSDDLYDGDAFEYHLMGDALCVALDHEGHGCAGGDWSTLIKTSSQLCRCDTDDLRDIVSPSLARPFILRQLRIVACIVVGIAIGAVIPAMLPSRTLVKILMPSFSVLTVGWLLILSVL